MCRERLCRRGVSFGTTGATRRFLLIGADLIGAMTLCGAQSFGHAPWIDTAAMPKLRHQVIRQCPI